MVKPLAPPDEQTQCSANLALHFFAEQNGRPRREVGSCNLVTFFWRQGYQSQRSDPYLFVFIDSVFLALQEVSVRLTASGNQVLKFARSSNALPVAGRPA